MFKSRDLRIRTRILLIAGGVFGFLVLVGAIFYLNVAQIEQTHRLLQHSETVVGSAQRIGRLIARMERDFRDYLAFGEQSALDRFRLTRGEATAALTEAGRLVGDNPAQAERLARVRALVDDWAQGSAELKIEARRRGGDPFTLVGSERNQQFSERAHAQLDEFIRAEELLLDARDRDVADSLRSAVWRTVLSTLIVAALAIALVLFVSRQITDGVAGLAAAMDEVEAGNLHARALVRGRDELGQLGLRFNAMIARLEAAATELRQRDVQAAVTAVARALSSGEPAVMLNEGLEAILRATGCPAGVIYLYDGEAGRLAPAAVAGAGEEVRARAYQVGEDLVGRVAQGRDPLYTRAGEARLLVNHWGGSFAPAELAYLPLLHRDRLVGVLGLARLEPFDDLSRNALQIIAGQLALAIVNAQSLALARDQAATNALLFEEQSKAAARAEELLNVSRDISTLNLGEILDSLTTRTRRLLASDLAAVAIAEAGATRWLAANGTRTAAHEGRVFEPGRGISGRAVSARRTTVIQGPGEDSRFPAEEFAVLAAEGIKSAAAAPLLVRGRAFGALIVGARSGHDFTEDELRLLEGLAGQAAVAIDNAQQYEQIERQHQELAEATRLKSQFLANMSHELRTPMAIILGFTKTVLRGTQGPLTSEQRESLGLVHDHGQHLLKLINEVLDLSKIEAGRMELHAEPFAPRELLASAAESFAGLARQKGIELRSEVEPTLPAMVRQDRARVQQILNNLLSNAIKFTDRGAVTLAARGAPDGRWELSVRDTGVGIAEPDLPRIFEEFHQLDGSATRKAGGTGLGLSIVKRLVALLRGDLAVESRPGAGSTFTVTLPAALEAPPRATGPLVLPAATAPLAAPGPSGVAGMADAAQELLAIDDDLAFLRLIEANLGEAGYRVLTARNGADGLRVAREARPRAIILDVQMPDMDGWRVLRELKSDARTAEIPVIMLSVVDDPRMGFSLGATDYLVKPYERDHLVAALRRLRVAPGPGATVLVVDDDPAMRRLLETQLSAQGFTVRTAADGEAALAQVEAQPPDAIILDLMMPVMDGFEVIHRLKADLRRRPIPIIVLTAKELTASDVNSINGSIEKIVRKGGTQAEDLIRELRQTLAALGVADAS